MRNLIFLFGILLLSITQSESFVVKRDARHTTQSPAPGFEKIIQDVSNCSEIFMKVTVGNATVDKFLTCLQTLTRDVDNQLSLLSVVVGVPILGEFLGPFILLLRSYVSQIPAIGFLLSQILVGPDPYER